MPLLPPQNAVSELRVRLLQNCYCVIDALVYQHRLCRGPEHGLHDRRWHGLPERIGLLNALPLALQPFDASGPQHQVEHTLMFVV